MRLSDLSIRRPVLATVASLLLIAFGLLAVERLPLQEYPAIDPPIVSIETAYPGASASVVETRITQLIEDRIAGIEGIVSIESSSADGESEIDVEFSLDRDIDAAANDIRDRVSSVADNLPDQADPPEIEKSDSSDDVIVWLSLSGEGYTIPELTDYANRYLVDRFSTQSGVARVRLSGGKEYAMRVWLDRNALAARGLTVDDVAASLEAENVELPAGFLESRDRQFTLRIPRNFVTADDFRRLVVARGGNGYLVRLGDIARVEVGSVEERSLYRGNGVPMVGLGMIKQSTASVLEVAEGAKAEMARLRQTLPEGMTLSLNFDSSIFVAGALHEVIVTLFIAMALVVVVIFVFLGNVRTTLVPAVTVPISLIGTFIFLALFGFTLNLLTLLALVLAIGLVVDDAIVVIENVHRRMVSHGETPLVAAYRGTREIGFAVIATTLVLVTVFVPLSLLQGDIGRLFSEFALTLAAAVALSCLVALSLAPMLCSKLLSPRMHENRISRTVHWLLERSQNTYRRALMIALRWRWAVVGSFCLLLAATAWLFQQLPNEYTPREDRGAFFVLIEGPPGATFRYMQDYYDEIEARLMTLVDRGEINQVSMRGPRGFGSVENFNDGMAIVTLKDWSERRSAWEIMAEIRERLDGLPGVTAVPVMRQGFGGRVEKPVQFVLGGGTYEALVDWRDRMLARIRTDDSGLEAVDSDYKETQPQLRIEIDYDRAASLGVTVSTIGNTLETLFGGRNVTTYVDNGEEYDVILEGERDRQRQPSALDNVQVRSATSGALIPLASLVTVSEFAGASELNRFNRMRAITLEANLADGVALGDALDYLQTVADEELPIEAVIDYKGPSRDFQEASGATQFLLALGILVVFLVLAAQFESFIHPLVIMLTVPLAISGALLGLWVSGQSLNIYSQVGLVMLVGLAAKNGILIVEFANQLRDQGREFTTALVDAAVTRLRPILMTTVTTMAGAVPLLLAFGPGSESRLVIGTVIFCGVAVATLLTLFVVPVAYALLARRTGSPGDVARRLEREMQPRDDA
ncbi:efflux RND transporter permease subunit [Salinicola rhizosphaerae]|uniref:Multidrug transporter n=1 Tax=Salinicola rhizosphaerae TaxID=1443141 RepID=A0ABQ3EC60_9GAMM|nr:efflux RND transporter permease subunit [Salinicola rhizosphaerae]GHB29502.1 multidrug transporter [Salinicola rhizosphaerae]